jgi:hypothetical protein
MLKKNIVFFLVLITIIIAIGCSNQNSEGSTNLAAQPNKNPNFDFRNIKWGMSMEEVVQSEGNQGIVEDNTMLFNNVNIAGLSAQLNYTFNSKNQVFSGVYTFNDSYATENNYNTIKTKLVNLYGSPTSEDNSKSVLSSEWDLENTIILISCIFDDHDLSLSYQALNISA